MISRLFLVLGIVSCDAVTFLHHNEKLDLCGERCGATICAKSTCFVDYGACNGGGILGSALTSKVSLAAPAPGPSPGPAPGPPMPQVGDIVEITADHLPSKGLAFEVIQDGGKWESTGGDAVKLGNGKWYKIEYLRIVERSAIKPEHALDFFCRAACTARWPVIPTYPNGKLDLDVPPTVTDPNPRCLHDCRAGADSVGLCKGLCPKEGGMCLTECETMLHRCDDMYEDNFPKERMMCVKKACSDMSFKEEDDLPAHGHPKHLPMYKHIEDVSAAPASAPGPAPAA